MTILNLRFTDLTSFVLLAVGLLFAPTTLAQSDCSALPDHDDLTAALKESVKASGGPSNGGLDLNMWGTVVNRAGEVCAVTRTGDSSCADHNIAWRVREALGLDTVPSGVHPDNGDDGIIYDIGPDGASVTGFGHPTCGNREHEVAEEIGSGAWDPRSALIGPSGGRTRSGARPTRAGSIGRYLPAALRHGNDRFWPWLCENSVRI